ncbi:hypothetical protein ISP15_17070 [Dyella jejuensis]|uniref:Uncharacterized protein n=1 Tax=Dyella jejuensis TaxID=1432009 RepID=A0ABW8JP79_9GAMM
MAEIVPDGAIPKLLEPFNFAWLEALIAARAEDNGEPATTRLDRYAVIGVLLFGLLGVLGSLLFHNRLGLRLLQSGFALQWVCIAVVLVNAGWRAWLAYRHQHESFARDLDRQLAQYDEIINAVCRHSLPVIATHLRYVRDRKSRLVYRGGLISGGMDKLAILPLFLAMYLQFKDWSFGGWKALLDHVHMLSALLLSMLFATYLISWWAARAKDRLELYEMVLMEASVRSADESVTKRELI